MRKLIFSIFIINGILICFVFPSYFYAEGSLSDTFKKAQAFFFEKKFVSSEKLLQKIIEANPSNEDALSLLGDIYFFKKEWNKAISYYQQVLEIAPNSSTDLFRLGQTYLAIKDSVRADEYFKIAYKVDPSLTQSLFQLGYIELMYNRNKLKTISFWEDFLKKTPNDAQYDNVYKAIQLLKDKNFKIPAKDSNISIEEALLLGGKNIQAGDAKIKDKKAGNANSKESNKIKGLLEDNEL